MQARGQLLIHLGYPLFAPLVLQAESAAAIPAGTLVQTIRTIRVEYFLLFFEFFRLVDEFLQIFQVSCILLEL
jgi:hypothetical protein